MTQRSFCRKGFVLYYTSRSKSIIEGTQGRNSEQEPWRNTVYWLAHWVMFSQPSYEVHAHLLRDRASHSGLGPHTSIKTVPRVNLINVILQLSSLFPGDSSLGEVDNKSLPMWGNGHYPSSILIGKEK